MNPLHPLIICLNENGSVVLGEILKYWYLHYCVPFKKYVTIHLKKIPLPKNVWFYVWKWPSVSKESFQMVDNVFLQFLYYLLVEKDVDHRLTNLNPLHQMMICVWFKLVLWFFVHGCISLIESGSFILEQKLTSISTISLVHPLLKNALVLISKNSNAFTQACLVPSVVEIWKWSIVLERKLKMWNTYIQTDGQTDRRQVIRSFQLRRAINKALQILTTCICKSGWSK